MGTHEKNYDMDLSQSLEDVDLNELPSTGDEASIKAAAKNTKNRKALKSANLRIYKEDFDAIIEMAEKAGMDYQPFLRALIHRYTTNQLIDTQNQGRPTLIMLDIDQSPELASATAEIMAQSRKLGVNVMSLHTSH